MANAVARISGRVTFARIVFAGPVLKNRKNTATNTQPQAYGNGTNSIATKTGNAARPPPGHLEVRPAHAASPAACPRATRRTASPPARTRTTIPPKTDVRPSPSVIESGAVAASTSAPRYCSSSSVRQPLRPAAP